MQIYSNKKFKNPIKIIESFDSQSFKSAILQIEQLSKKYYLIGYIRYESKDVFLNRQISSELPLLYFEVYKNFENFEYEKYDLHKSSPITSIKPEISFDRYKEDLTKIKEEIANGNTYEVNYTYNYLVKTNSQDIDVYKYLLTKQKTPYNTFIKNKYETVMSFSPELFFYLRDGKILTKPMKGTVKRGSTEQEDKENIKFLKNDIKNRAENVMIVDLLRNDLSKIAKTGSVKVQKLFDIETHKTLHQMTSEITANVSENKNLYDILEAIFPCGSITGAPKISTMEIIEQLEFGKRNIYCGAIGFLSPQETIFSVPIRILQKASKENHYKYRVGGAIVWDSDIKDEWEETVTKMSFLNTEKEDFKIIETIKIENKKFILGKEHFKRMKNSAKLFGFNFNDTAIDKLEPTQKDGISRILLSKDGKIEIEYKPIENARTNTIQLSPKHIESSNQFIYHKTTYRPWYKSSYEKIKNAEIYDEIFFNENGELTEGARTNIVLQQNGKMYTPPVTCGLLNGILRQKLINEKEITEKVLYKKDLLSAEKIFCINSVRGIKEVFLK